MLLAWAVGREESWIIFIKLLLLYIPQYARARNTLSAAKVCRVLWVYPATNKLLISYLLQENYTGYEFEARLNFKVHSAMGLCY